MFVANANTLSNLRTLTNFRRNCSEIKDIQVIPFILHARLIGINGFPFREIEGIPLKEQVVDAEGTDIFEVVEINRQTLPATDFQVPAGYLLR